jgi:hypothetical protein
MKIKILLLIIASSSLVAILFAGSCERFVETYYSIQLKNQASNQIKFYVNGYGFKHIYPDTLLPDEKIILQTVKSNEVGKTYFSARWEDYFQALPSDTLSIFIFDSQIIDTTEWAKIRDDYKILKRYDLSLKDLQRLDFTVTYPPDASMANIKMYPK